MHTASLVHVNQIVRHVRERLVFSHASFAIYDDNDDSTKQDTDSMTLDLIVSNVPLMMMMMMMMMTGRTHLWTMTVRSHNS